MTTSPSYDELARDLAKVMGELGRSIRCNCPLPYRAITPEEHHESCPVVEAVFLRSALANMTEERDELLARLEPLNGHASEAAKKMTFRLYAIPTATDEHAGTCMDAAAMLLDVSRANDSNRSALADSERRLAEADAAVHYLMTSYTMDQYEETGRVNAALIRHKSRQGGPSDAK